MQPVKQVLGSLDGGAPTIERVNELMRKGRGFFYSYTTPYVAQTPEVTASTRAGDCKAKALWLCDQLRDQNVRFVVGKAHYGADLSLEEIARVTGTRTTTIKGRLSRARDRLRETLG